MESSAARNASGETASSRLLMNAMGRFMLQGYTMTSQHCPICTTVLLRSREGEMFCSKCNAPVVVADDDSSAPAAPPATAASASAPSAAVPRSTAAAATVASPPPAAAAVTSPAAAPKSDKRSLAPRDVAAQRLGQRLLQGWRMLEDSCDICNTPWMAHKASPRKFCVFCDEWQDVLQAKSAPVAPPPVAAAPAPHVEALASGGVPEGKQDDKAASLGLLAHLRRYAEADDDEDETAAADGRYADAEGEPEPASAAPPVVDFIAALDAAEDDEEAIRIQLRSMRGVAPASAAAGGSNGWAAALGDVHAGIAADAAHGPSARVLTHQQASNARATAALPPNAATVPVFGAVRVMDAPAGWASMTREQLNAYAAGSSPAAAAAAVAAPPVVDDAPVQAATESLIQRAKGMSDGAVVPVEAREGNIGPSGTVVLMQRSDIVIQAPEQARVVALAQALQQAEQDDLQPEPRVARAAAAVPTAPAAAAPPVPSAPVTATPVTATPVGINAAIAALTSHLAAENARMVALIATCAGGTSSHGEEGVSIVAARVARCADALRALHALQSVAGTFAL